MIAYPTILSEPLRLRQAAVLAIAVDEGLHERFAIVDDPDWVTDAPERRVIGHLWTTSTGGKLPLLSLKRRVPDCAIVFAGSPALPLVPRAATGHPAPSRRPLPDRLEAGLLLCTGDGDRLPAALAGWPTSLTVHRNLVAQAHVPVRPSRRCPRRRLAIPSPQPNPRR